MNAIISSWGSRAPLRKSQGFAQELVRATQLKNLSAQSVDLLSFSGAAPWGFAKVDTTLLPPGPQGVK